MNGTVTSISGATVCVDLADLKIGDRVFVGTSHLTGEVVRIDDKIATVQVCEENRGLKAKIFELETIIEEKDR